MSMPSRRGPAAAASGAAGGHAGSPRDAKSAACPRRKQPFRCRRMWRRVALSRQPAGRGEALPERRARCVSIAQQEPAVRPIQESTPRSPARRRLLKALVVVAAGVPFASRPGWLHATPMPSGSSGSRLLFPQSVASGDPRPDQVLLWTRSPAAAGEDVPLRLQVADDPRFLQLRVERELVARAEADHCLRVRVQGLQPGRAYHYRFLRREGQEWVASAAGRTRTAPPADAPTPAMKFAFISCQDYGGVAIWDDHEFSDDCWQDQAAYSNGRRDDGDRQRRRNAEQAYFEYMPVDVEVGGAGDDGVLAIDAERLHPHTRMWRALDFGRDLRLMLLDYRSQRPDHPIPEDAFPGALAYDQQALQRLLPTLGLDYATLAPQLLPYLDLADEAWKHLRKPLRRALASAYAGEGLDRRAALLRAQALSQAPMALMVVRDILQRYNAAVPALMEVELPAADGDHRRGLPWLALGKQKLFSHVGSRYLVTKESYELLLALREAEGRLPLALGREQQSWLLEQLATSAARWKVVASSVSMTSMVFDLARPQLQAPALMQRKFYLNVDQWDGFGRQRDALVQAMDQAGGAVVLSGDIHAGFATQLSPRTVEFTVPAVSSQTLRDILAGSAQDDPATADTARRLVDTLDEVLADGEARIRYAQASRHGAGLVEIGADGQWKASFMELPAETCLTCLYQEPEALQAQLKRVGFGVGPESRRLRVLAGEAAAPAAVGEPG
ncbi:MAG: hypothetical protein EOP91_10480 [Lysobacteraceae bacterium]|nr:MAG: hypothetical protein EOP91_10480 [Xanthomonadaceae bacterium]